MNPVSKVAHIAQFMASHCKSYFFFGRSVGRLRRLSRFCPLFSEPTHFGHSQKREICSIDYYVFNIYIFCLLSFSNFALALIPIPTYMHRHTHIKFTITKRKFNMNFVCSFVRSVVHLQCNLKHMVDIFFLTIYTFFYSFFIFYENSIIHNAMGGREKNSVISFTFCDLCTATTPNEFSMEKKVKFCVHAWVCAFVFGS